MPHLSSKKIKMACMLLPLSLSFYYPHDNPVRYVRLTDCSKVTQRPSWQNRNLNRLPDGDFRFVCGLCVCELSFCCPSYYLVIGCGFSIIIFHCLCKLYRQFGWMCGIHIRILLLFIIQTGGIIDVNNSLDPPRLHIPQTSNKLSVAIFLLFLFCSITSKPSIT